MAPLKIYRYWLLAGIMLFISSTIARAQYKLQDIPILKVTDFKGKRPAGAKAPIYTDVKINLKIETATRNKNGKYKLTIKAIVNMNEATSYWDLSEAEEYTTPRKLEHEQGYIYLAYIAANKLEKRLQAISYTDKWKDEAKEKFIELSQSYGVKAVDYDNQTSHGANIPAQEDWNAWIKKQLK